MSLKGVVPPFMHEFMVGHISKLPEQKLPYHMLVQIVH